MEQSAIRHQSAVAGCWQWGSGSRRCTPSPVWQPAACAADKTCPASGAVLVSGSLCWHASPAQPVPPSVDRAGSLHKHMEAAAAELCQGWIWPCRAKQLTVVPPALSVRSSPTLPVSASRLLPAFFPSQTVRHHPVSPGPLEMPYSPALVSRQVSLPALITLQSDNKAYWDAGACTLVEGWLHPSYLSCHGEITWQLLMSPKCVVELLRQMALGYTFALVGFLRAVYICGNTWIQMTKNRKACAGSASLLSVPKRNGLSLRALTLSWRPGQHALLMRWPEFHHPHITFGSWQTWESVAYNTTYLFKRAVHLKEL